MMTEAIFKQSLIDSNISKENAKYLLELFHNNKETEIMKILKNERGKKLEMIHKDEYELNIIDYLLNFFKNDYYKKRGK